MDKSRNVGKVYCRVCLESFQTTTSFLSEPVDIYNDWVDACEAANWWWVATETSIKQMEAKLSQILRHDDDDLETDYHGGLPEGRRRRSTAKP